MGLNVGAGTETGQEPKGRKTGSKKWPNEAIYEFSISSPPEVAPQGWADRNQTMSTVPKIMVPALTKNHLPRSHMCMITVFAVGIE